MEFLKEFKNDASYVAYLKVYNEIEKKFTNCCARHKEMLNEVWDHFNILITRIMNGDKDPEKLVDYLDTMERTTGTFVLSLFLGFINEYDKVRDVLSD
jgi:hypothetical protein